MADSSVPCQILRSRLTLFLIFRSTILACVAPSEALSQFRPCRVRVGDDLRYVVRGFPKSDPSSRVILIQAPLGA